MKKATMLLIALLGVTLIMSVGCDNTSARVLGGTMTLNLEPNQKLVNVTWKDRELWYLTRPMREDEEPETLTFQAKTDFGIIEGKVIIEESKE